MRFFVDRFVRVGPMANSVVVTFGTDTVATAIGVARRAGALIYRKMFLLPDAVANVPITVFKANTFVARLGLSMPFSVCCHVITANMGLVDSSAAFGLA